MIRKLTHSRFFAAHPALFFWGCYLALNALLFLPLYLLDGGDNTLLPALQSGLGWREVLNAAMIWRANLDPLRINVEFALLMALWVALPSIRRAPFRVLVYAFYGIALVYAIYEAIVLSIWLIDPVFYSQWFLARDGLPFLLNNLGAQWWMIVGLVAALIAAGWAIIALLRIALSSGATARINWITKGVMILLAGIGLVALLRYQVYTARPEMVQSSTVEKIAKNLHDSVALHAAVAAFDDSTLRAAYNFDAATLQRHPDIFVIYVESYGSVLYKRDDWKLAYGALIDELTETLGDSGWQSASAFSTSPTWGGGSWLAYTSGLMGTMIDTQPQYLDLRKRYDTDPYPNLGHALQQKGYWFAWLSALDDDYDASEWAELERFYGNDQMIRYEDLGYHGGGFGWGDSPPDQYTLHWAIEMLRAAQKAEAASPVSGSSIVENQTVPAGTIPAGSTVPAAVSAAQKPILLYTITQNSHYPFAPQPPLVDDWLTLTEQPADDAAREAALAAEPPVRRANYLAAIDYQLRMLVNLVLTEGDDDSLFILIGDHQPPTVSRRADGFETPVHIISRNSALMEAFADEGFTPGLRIQDGSEIVMDHAGLYGLLMQVLTSTQPNLEEPILHGPTATPQLVGVLPED